MAHLMYTTSLLLDKSTENLRMGLRAIEQQMIDAGTSVYVSHDKKSKIIVYIDSHFKAYVPKIYDSWPVDIIEWNGGRIALDLDTAIV